MTLKNFLTLYTVHNIPLILRPLYWLYGYGLGCVFFLYYFLLNLTCTIEYLGREKLIDRNYIYCIWHHNGVPYFASFIRHQRDAWMQDPSWYMKPSHVVIKLLGIEKIFYGSTGHSGREAADGIVSYLKKGYSTTVLTDGPHGPPKVMRKGALHMSLQSGVAIVPIRFKLKRYLKLRTWDHKRLPLPFSRIEVTFGVPVQVSQENFDQAYYEINSAL